MTISTKKLRSGFELPVYGLGTWGMGGREKADNSNDQREIEAIQTAIEQGITHIDTAEIYGAGHAEELLGQAIKGYTREKLIIATKVAGWNQGYDELNQSFQASLKRIGTDYIDLYLLHSFPDPGIDIANTTRALDELVEQGVVKNIGVCNMTVERFKLTQAHTKNKLVCNQLHYNVQYREIEAKGVLKFSQQNDVMIIAWRPLQKGVLPKSALIDGLAAKYGKSPSQIAIRWLISQDSVVTISKTSHSAHLQENLGAVGWELDQEDVELIRQKFPNQKLVSDAVPLDYKVSNKSRWV